MGLVEWKLLLGMGRGFWLIFFFLLSVTCQGDQILVVADKRVMGNELCRTPPPCTPLLSRVLVKLDS